MRTVGEAQSVSALGVTLVTPGLARDHAGRRTNGGSAIVTGSGKLRIRDSRLMGYAEPASRSRPAAANPNAFRYADLHPLSVHRRCGVLAARLSQPKPLPACGQLSVLRMVGLAVLAPDDRLDGPRLLHRHPNRRYGRPQGPQVIAGALAGH